MRRRLQAVAVFGLVSALALAVAAVGKPRNGGFETGDFTGWKPRIFESGPPRGGGPGWRVYSGKPVLSSPGSIPPPRRGQHAAVIDKGAGLAILHRVLRLRRDAVNKLRFFLAWDNSHFRWHNRGSLDPGLHPNQQIRVDILKRGAPIDSVQPRHILTTLFRSRPNTPLERGYRKHTYNLTRRGVDQRRVRLRFVEVDNQFFLNLGVDHVKQITGARRADRRSS